jgi:hypothetical protein
VQSDTILIQEIHTPEDKISALNDERVSMIIFQTNGGLYVTTSLEEDLSSSIPGCQQISQTTLTSYFIPCSKQELPILLEEHFKKRVTLQE